MRTKAINWISACYSTGQCEECKQKFHFQLWSLEYQKVLCQSNDDYRADKRNCLWMSIGHWTLDTAADVVSGHIAIGET